MPQRTYLAIDLKSFYASAECIARGLDPLKTNLTVADISRTEKTICLAVTPPLKSYGIPGRARLFEVVQKVKEANARRLAEAIRTGRASKQDGRYAFSGESSDAEELAADAAKAIGYIVAPPRMNLYMSVSTRIYQLYLRYFAPEDIHVYSIDECFIDATEYLALYGLSARALTGKLIGEIFAETGITATGGIGTNLYLCKVALDIVSKHVPPDANGVRIAELNERTYRETLWAHQPITDFWRVGRGIARRLEEHQLLTMGDVARCSLGGDGDILNEALLYRIFGVNAELLIDHAWGRESCSMADIKAYKPEISGTGSGQVLEHPYTKEEAAIVMREMAGALALELVSKGLTADQVTVDVGYDRENVDYGVSFSGPAVTDRYGRSIPKPAHGSARFARHTASDHIITEKALEIFERIADPSLTIRRLNITAGNVLTEAEAARTEMAEQLSLFDMPSQPEPKPGEKRLQQATLAMKQKFGKNAVLKGTDLQKGATAIQRNSRVGGHAAGEETTGDTYRKNDR